MLANQLNKVKPLPPFGKEAAYLCMLAAPPRNDIFLFAGQYAWNKAKAFK